MSWQPPPGYLERQPPFQPPRKSWPRRHPVWTTVLGVFTLFVVIIIVSAIVAAPKSSSPSAAVPSLPKSVKATVSPVPSPTPVLSAGQTKFVASVKSAMAAHSQSLTSSDAQVAAVGQQVCTALGSGASQSSIISASKDAKSRLDMSGKKLVLLSEKDLCRKYLPKPPRVIARFNGSGTQNTPSFTVSAQWHLSWAYWGCSGGNGNFAVTEANTDGSDDINGVTVNELGSGRGPVATYAYGDGGRHYFQVLSECSWSPAVVVGGRG